MTAQLALLALIYLATLAGVYFAAVAVLTDWLLPTAEVQAARDARKAAKVEAYNLARLIETYR